MSDWGARVAQKAATGPSGYELMRHALGAHEHCLHPSKGGIVFKKPYRNHFVAGMEHEGIWDDLVAKGFATKRKGNQVTGGDPVFYVTDAGREAALAGITFKRRWGYGKPTNP